MLQRAQSQLWQNPWKRQRSLFTKALQEEHRTWTKANFGETKGTLPSTLKCLAYKELHASNTSSPSSALISCPPRSLYSSRSLNSLNRGRPFLQPTAFTSQTLLLQPPCRTRKFKISPESSIFILVGGRRSEMCFSPLSAFNYDQTFQFDAISQRPEPAWSFTPQFGRKAEFNSWGLSHPAPISEFLMDQKRSWAIFQLIGHILDPIQPHILWGF